MICIINPKMTAPKKLSLNAMKRYVGTSDMILLAYAPWCYHCVNFKPVYAQFAEKARSEVPHVHVVSVDADKYLESMRENEIGTASYEAPISDAIQGFPTILFLSKKNAAVYGGDRNVDSMIQSAKTFFKRPPQ